MSSTLSTSWTTGGLSMSSSFGQGDGCLQYYFYNWKFPTISPNEVGLVML